jgi:hypothetical protein
MTVLNKYLMPLALLCIGCTSPAAGNNTADSVRIEACLSIGPSGPEIQWTITNPSHTPFDLWEQSLPWAPSLTGAKLSLARGSNSPAQGRVSEPVPKGSSRETTTLRPQTVLKGTTKLRNYFDDVQPELLDARARVIWNYEFLPKGSTEGRSFSGTLSADTRCQRTP